MLQEMFQREKEAEYFREWEKQEDTVSGKSMYFKPFGDVQKSL